MLSLPARASDLEPAPARFQVPHQNVRNLSFDRLDRIVTERILLGVSASPGGQRLAVGGESDRVDSSGKGRETMLLSSRPGIPQVDDAVF
jgi:hypothetical protein